MAEGLLEKNANSFYPPDADDAAGFTSSITVMAVGGGLLVYGKPPLAPAHPAVGKRTRPPQGRERGRAQVSGSVLGAWWRCEMRFSSLLPRVSAPDGQISLPEPGIWKQQGFIARRRASVRHPAGDTELLS